MSNVEPDGRFGGLVPLQRVEDINPSVSNAEDVLVSPLFLEPNVDGSTTLDTGQNFNPNDLIVEDDDNSIRLPVGDGSSQTFQLDQLSPEQAQQLLALVQQQDPGIRSPFVGGGGVGAPAQFTGLQNPFPTNPFSPLERNLRSQVAQNEQATADLRIREARFGLSHPEISGNSLVEQQFSPFSLDRSTLLNNVQRTADDWFSEELNQLNTVGRQTEQRLRTALLDIEAFVQDELGEDLELRASDLIALRDSYRERLDQVRELRTVYGDDLRRRREAVAAGDINGLPEALALSPEQALQIEAEADEREFTLDKFGRWAQLANSTEPADRLVTELARGYLGNTYSALDMVAQLNISNPQSETGDLLFSTAQRRAMADTLSDMLGLDPNTFQPTETGPGFNPAYLNESQLGFMDQIPLGFDDFVQTGNGTSGVIDREILLAQAVEQLGSDERTLPNIAPAENPEERDFNLNFPIIGETEE